ncbi:YadA-like family protein [Veillonella intestinalis]|uniref:YadA-like family protein n=1 Tax=Veillonella intestinalis TaxID=2941341 RepID=UPI002040DAA3|nr:YadA-like family protein [Veillonella intestinalis]
MTKTKSLKTLSLALAVAALTGTMTTAFAATNVVGTGNGVAFGEGAVATKKPEGSVALGTNADGAYKGSVAIGNNAAPSGNDAIAIGTDAHTTASPNAISIGKNAATSWTNNIAMGTDSISQGRETIAIGHESFADGGEAVSIGVKSSAQVKQSVALGNESVVERKATAGVAVGHKANVSGKYGLAMGDEAISSGNYSAAIGTNAKAEGTKSLAFGHGANAVSDNSIALGNATSANVADTKAEESYLSKEAYTSEEAGVVSVGNADSNLYRRITNVAGGAADHDAVNVLQLKSLESNLNDKIENLDSTSATIGGNTTINEGGITVTSPETGNTTVINGDSVTTTTVNADKVVVGGNTYITKDGIDANNQTIKNVAPGVNGTDAVNLDQLNQATSTLNSSISHLETNVKKVAAGSAALAALHPLDFDSDDKLTFAVGFGAYKGEQAAAIGAFYRPNDNLMFSIGTALGNSDNQYNAGLSFKFGDSSPYTNMSKADMVNKLETQEKNMATLQADNAELKARLAKLEALVAGN